MIAYRIQRKSNNTDFYTSDFINIWDEIDDGDFEDPLVITKHEMTSAEFIELMKTNSKVIEP
jgi:hypothetical protein